MRRVRCAGRLRGSADTLRSSQPDMGNACVMRAAQSSNEEGRTKIREASDAVARLLRS